MRDYGHGPDDRTGDKLMGLCRNDRTEAARRTCRCSLQSRMTRLSRRRRHNFRKNAVRDAENFRLTPMPQISGWATWLQAISVMIAAGSAVYSFGAWRRQLIGSKKAEAAEKLLACCYEARDTIDVARSPISFDNEGKARPYSVGETEAQGRLFDRYWTPAERLTNKTEFFAKFAAAQYLARA